MERIIREQAAHRHDVVAEMPGGDHDDCQSGQDAESHIVSFFLKRFFRFSVMCHFDTSCP